MSPMPLSAVAEYVVFFPSSLQLGGGGDLGYREAVQSCMKGCASCMRVGCMEVQQNEMFKLLIGTVSFNFRT